MKISLRNAFRQLRWKLTLSYTAVAVGAMLIVLLVLVFFSLSALLLPSGILTPTLLIEATSEQAVPIFRTMLADPSPDLIQIDAFLQVVNLVGGTISGRDLLQLGQIRLTARVTADVDYLIVGPGGVLLGRSDPALLPLAPLGKPFDPARVPGLEGPLQAALAGETDPELIFATIRPDREYIWALPVTGSDDRSDEVLGAIVVHLDSYPTQSDLLPIALTWVARGLLLGALTAAAVGTLFGSLTAEGMVNRFQRLWSATEAWSRGDFSRLVHDPSGDEIGEFARRLNAMAVQMKKLLRERQQMAVAEERNRLARDLHDSAKQQALAASFQLGTALTLFESDPSAARQHLVEADNLVDSVRLELTDLIHELRPPSAENWDLSAMLQDYVTDWAHQNDIRTELNVQNDRPLPLELEQAIYRITQEALANVARHSRAGRAAVTLASAGRTLRLTVSDNGAGFDPTGRFSGLGLHSMRERAEAHNGVVAIQSEPGRGTIVSATWTLE